VGREFICALKQIVREIIQESSDGALQAQREQKEKPTTLELRHATDKQNGPHAAGR
jgi:hypothetical protein